MESMDSGAYPIGVYLSHRNNTVSRAAALHFLAAVMFGLLLLFGMSVRAQAAPAFSQAAIDDAMGQAMVAFGSDSSGSHGDTPAVVHSATAFYYLSMVAHFNPDATSSSGASVAAHVLAFFRFYTAGGAEPSCSNPLYGWGDGPFGQGLLHIRMTPALWNALTAAEQGKADLLMEALAIAGNWGFNDANNFSTGLGGQGNFHKTNNPNYVQSYLGVELACSVYFGSAANCNTQAFTNFSFTPFMNALTAAGFTNITSAWSVTGAAAMNAAVTVPFVFNGVPLGNQNEIFYQMALPAPNSMYTGTVSNTGCGGAAHIDSGSSPVLGQSGQAHELASTDSSGCRSDALYSYEGWMGSVEGRSTLQNFGLWGGGPHTSQVEGAMSVGSQDLIYKLHQGYTGVSLAGTRDVSDAPSGLPAGKGYLYLHDIYNAVIASGVQANPDFSLVATPTSQSVASGSSANYTVAVSGIGGFSGTVSFVASGLPAGATAAFNPVSVNGSATTAFTVSTGSSTPAGSSTITITGTSGSLTHSVTVTLVVTTAPANFTLSASPGSQSVSAGNSTTYAVSVSPINGFSANVALNVTGLPSGASGVFNPASISGGSGSSILTISSAASTPAGTYSLTVTAISGSLSHSATVTLVVTSGTSGADFSLSVAPSTQAVTAGSSTTYMASVGALNGFAGTVSLSATGLPTGATASFSPASLTGSGSATMTVVTGTSTPVGSFTLTLTGSSGGISHSAHVALTVNAGGGGCVTATQGGPWQNTSFASQSGNFTVQFDATPSATGINSVIGLSNGAQTAYSGFAALVRFNPSGDIDARNGAAYAAATSIPYLAGMTYHFRVTVSVTTHSYSVFVTPPGGAELTVGSNFSFRTEQSTVASLDNFGAFAEVGSDTACNFTLSGGGTASCVTASQGGSWQNTSMAAQTGTFTAQFDATPSAAGINSVIGLSNGAQTAYSGFAVLARFNPSGDIDARNGAAYAAASTIAYAAGVTYHFRMVVDIPTHTYSVFVTAPGGAELTVGSNFAFRTEQSAVTSLDWVGVFAEVGADTECSFTVQ